MKGNTERGLMSKSCERLQQTHLTKEQKLEVQAMGQRNVFQNREKEQAVDGRTESSNHARGACADGALWNERRDPKSLLTGPLALSRN